MHKNVKAAVCFITAHGLLPGDLADDEMPFLVRQAADEILASRENKIPRFLGYVSPFQNTPAFEDEFKMKSEEWHDKLRFYDRKPVESLAGYRILLRSFLGHIPLALKSIADLGGENALGVEDMQVTDCWPLYVEHGAVKREVGIAKASELRTAAQRYCIDNRVFVKTARKCPDGHGTVAAIGEVMKTDKNGLPYRVGFGPDGKMGFMKVKPDTDIILSQPISLDRDDSETKEYRTWVIDNGVAAITRYGRPDDSDVPQAALGFAKDFAGKHAGKLPKHYVVDIGLAYDLGPVVIELNDLMAAGSTNKEIFMKIFNAYRKFAEA